jgi:hypothetical protein
MWGSSHIRDDLKVRIRKEKFWIYDTNGLKQEEKVLKYVNAARKLS